MKISVVMATYNGETYIEEQLQSIYDGVESSYELIICDDCSDDKTIEKIKSFQDKYKDANIKLVQNEKNLGFENNFNKALQMAQGDFIFFADQDDIWEQDKISKMISIMEKKSDCLLLCSDYEPFVCTNQAPKIPKNIASRMPNNGEIEKIKMGFTSVYLASLGCCMCMRKQFRDSMSSYWFDGWAQDDRCWKLALCMDGLYVVHENLVRHRLHDHNTATFGKYHQLDKRICLFTNMRMAALEMKYCVQEEKPDEIYEILLENHAKMMELRTELLEKRKFRNIIPLITYLRYYQAPKSYLVEIALAMKGFWGKG